MPLWLWVLVAAKAVALTDNATRAVTATSRDFFMVILLLCISITTNVIMPELAAAGMLNATEATDLTCQREEEKLARDV